MAGYKIINSEISSATVAAAATEAVTEKATEDDYDDYDEDMTQPVQASNESPVFYLCDTMYWGDCTWIVKYSPPIEAGASFNPPNLAKDFILQASVSEAMGFDVMNWVLKGFTL